jgi:hypothetical protein
VKFWVGDVVGEAVESLAAVALAEGSAVPEEEAELELEPPLAAAEVPVAEALLDEPVPDAEEDEEEDPVGRTVSWLALMLSVTETLALVFAALAEPVWDAEPEEVLDALPLELLLEPEPVADADPLEDFESDADEEPVAEEEFAESVEEAELEDDAEVLLSPPLLLFPPPLPLSPEASIWSVHDLTTWTASLPWSSLTGVSLISHISVTVPAGVSFVLVVLTVIGLDTSWRRTMLTSRVIRGVGIACTPAASKRRQMCRDLNENCMAMYWTGERSVQ